MKGKTKIGIEISKTEMLVIGTEVEIVNGWCGFDGYFYQCELPGGRQIVINSKNVEITDHCPYVNWEQRRYETAKGIMNGIISAHTVEEINNSLFNNDSVYKIIADLSVKLADALIERLKGGGR